MDLFESATREGQHRNAPLADRMRPRSLDEYIGQTSIVGKGRLLRRAIEVDQLSSLVFYGPPGTGKTTLAKIIANTTKGEFITLNAVLSGVKDIRDSIGQAKDSFNLFGKRTILFVDEVHRFNKAQQDALLPHVESGIIILIGATTENPYFEVNKALVSRSRIFQLQKLSEEELSNVLHQALDDEQRGYGKLQIVIEANAEKHLVNTANGDARTILNALELAVTTTKANEDGVINLTLDIIEESIQKRAVLYDKDGDAHYDIISAFIKSIRGSDPDAALYWMAKMIYAGEDPRFIFRRMIILASEDVGLADPNAISVVIAAAQAYDYIGMPEGRFPLSQACLYLATAPKSNTTLSLFDALRSVEQSVKDDVPNHLRDSSRDRDGFGHGEGYLYPHAYRDHWVEQQYLPEEFQGKVFYTPSDEGYEKGIKDLVLQRREAQLEAMLNINERGTFLWKGGSNGDWEKRTWEGEGDYLLELRKVLFDTLNLTEGSLVLDLSGGVGFLTAEALRQVSYGGVVTLVHSVSDWDTITNQYAQMKDVQKPILVPCFSTDTTAILHELEAYCFTHIIGRNCEDVICRLNQYLLDQIEQGAVLVSSQYNHIGGSKLSDFLVGEAQAYIRSAELDIINSKSILITDSFSVDSVNVMSKELDFYLQKRFSSKDVQYWFRETEHSLGGRIEAHIGSDEKQIAQKALLDQVVGKVLDWKSSVIVTKIKKGAQS